METEKLCKVAIGYLLEYEAAIREALRTLNTEQRTEEKRRQELSHKWAQLKLSNPNLLPTPEEMADINRDRTLIDHMYAKRKRQVLKGVKGNFEVKLLFCARVVGHAPSSIQSDQHDTKSNPNIASMWNQLLSCYERTKDLVDSNSAPTPTIPSSSQSSSVSDIEDDTENDETALIHRHNNQMSQSPSMEIIFQPEKVDTLPNEHIGVITDEKKALENETNVLKESTAPPLELDNETVRLPITTSIYPQSNLPAPVADTISRYSPEFTSENIKHEENEIPDERTENEKESAMISDYHLNSTSLPLEQRNIDDRQPAPIYDAPNFKSSILTIHGLAALTFAAAAALDTTPIKQETEGNNRSPIPADYNTDLFTPVVKNQVVMDNAECKDSSIEFLRAPENVSEPSINPSTSAEIKYSHETLIPLEFPTPPATIPQQNPPNKKTPEELNKKSSGSTTLGRKISSSISKISLKSIAMHNSTESSSTKPISLHENGIKRSKTVSPARNLNHDWTPYQQHKRNFHGNSHVAVSPRPLNKKLSKSESILFTEKKNISHNDKLAVIDIDDTLQAETRPQKPHENEKHESREILQHNNCYEPHESQSSKTHPEIHDLVYEEGTQFHELVISEIITTMEENKIMKASEVVAIIRRSRESTLKKIFSRLKDGGTWSNAGAMLARSASKVDKFATIGRIGGERANGSGIAGRGREDSKVTEVGVPKLVKNCCEALIYKGLEVQGILRVPGNKRRVEAIKAQMMKGVQVDFMTANPHDIATILKGYFREQKEPLLTYRLYKIFLRITTITSSDLQLYLLQLLIMLLSHSQRQTLHYLLTFLNSVASRQDQNSMDIKNIATVFGPNILRQKMKTSATVNSNAVGTSNSKMDSSLSSLNSFGTISAPMTPNMGGSVRNVTDDLGYGAVIEVVEILIQRHNELWK
ncbi:Rho GTPase-activating protein 6, partial [Nowakowskiella sp. JEL0407]